MNDNALNTPVTDSATASAAFEDPWAAASAPALEPVNTTAPESTADADPWAASYAEPDTASGSSDWLSTPSPTYIPEHDGGIGQLWHQITTEGLPVQDSINNGLAWVVDHFRPFFQAVRTPIDATLNGVTDVLQTIPMPVL
ncbi:MAG: proline/glycine betaine ABC transporter permease ProW, partial [Comamonas sp.]